MTQGLVTGTSWPVMTIHEMASIPADIRPRFLEQFPVMLNDVSEMLEMVPQMAEEIEAPWWYRFLGPDAKIKVVLRGLAAARPTWTDDGLDFSVIKMFTGNTEGEPVFVRHKNPSTERKPVRGLDEHGTYEDAVTYVLDVCSEDTDLFLRAWREGNLAEWPEYYQWLNETGR